MSCLFRRSKVEMFPEGVLATVEESIQSDRKGRVKFQGTYWPAKLHKCSDTLAPSSSVLVVGIEGITLLIVPSPCDR